MSFNPNYKESVELTAREAQVLATCMSLGQAMTTGNVTTGMYAADHLKAILTKRSLTDTFDQSHFDKLLVRLAEISIRAGASVTTQGDLIGVQKL